MPRIQITDTDLKKGFVTVKVGGVYVQFQNLRGEIKYNCKRRNSPGKTWISSEDFSKAADKAAKILNVPNYLYKNKKEIREPYQLSLF